MVTCNGCHSSRVEDRTEQSSFAYRGVNLCVDVDFSICLDCDLEKIRKEQILINDARAEHARCVRDRLVDISGFNHIAKGRVSIAKGSSSLGKVDPAA